MQFSIFSTFLHIIAYNLIKLHTIESRFFKELFEGE